MRFRALISLSTLAFLVTFAPSASAAPCQKPRQMKLLWDGVNNIGQLVFVTYGCAVPPGCPAKTGTLSTKTPLKIVLKAGDTTLFSSELAACDNPEKCKSLNTGGCPGGTDAHKGGDGLVKFSYQRRGMASITARLRASMQKPPETKGPVTVTVTDGAGYTSEVTYNQCRFNAREKSATMMCR